MRPSYLAGGKQSQAAQYQVPASLGFFLFNNNERCHLLPIEMPDVLCAQQSPSALKNLAKALWAGQPCPGCKKYVSHLNCPQDSKPVYRCLQQHWLPLRTKCSFPSRAEQINIVWELVITFFFKYPSHLFQNADLFTAWECLWPLSETRQLQRDPWREQMAVAVTPWMIPH